MDNKIDMVISERDSNIYKERKAGTTLDDLSKKYDLTKERVRQICLKIDEREQWMNDRVYAVLYSLASDKRNATKAYKILKRTGYHTEEKIVTLTEERILKIRSCGLICKDLIVKTKEIIEKENM